MTQHINPQQNSSAPEQDNPAPLSDALHIPTLIGGKSETKDVPAPLSDALHIPTLVGEAKTSPPTVSDTPADEVQK